MARPQNTQSNLANPSNNAAATPWGKYNVFSLYVLVMQHTGTKIFIRGIYSKHMIRQFLDHKLYTQNSPYKRALYKDLEFAFYFVRSR